MTDQSNDSIPLTSSEGEESPRYKHLRKLSAEAAALKKAKEQNKPTRVEYELVSDSRGKPKYRKIIHMPNGTKHSQYLAPHSLEAQRLKAKKNKLA